MNSSLQQSFENFSNSQSESKRMIVGRIGVVILLRTMLNKCMLPRRRIDAGIKNEAKKDDIGQAFSERESFSRRL